MERTMLFPTLGFLVEIPLVCCDVCNRERERETQRVILF